MNDAETFSLIRERLASGRDAELTVTGSSMEPLFKDGITRVRLVPFSGALRRYDIALYSGENGSAVLHRYVGKRRGLLRFRGDGARCTDRYVSREQICGVAVSSFTCGRSVNLKGAKQRTYGAFLSFKHFFGKSFRAVKRGGKNMLSAFRRALRGKND